MERWEPWASWFLRIIAFTVAALCALSWRSFLQMAGVWMGGSVNRFGEGSPWYKSVEISLQVAERAESAIWDWVWPALGMCCVAKSLCQFISCCASAEAGTVVQPWWWFTLFFSLLRVILTSGVFCKIKEFSVEVSRTNSELKWRKWCDKCSF